MFLTATNGMLLAYCAELSLPERLLDDKAFLFGQLLCEHRSKQMHQNHVKKTKSGRLELCTTCTPFRSFGHGAAENIKTKTEK